MSAATTNLGVETFDGPREIEGPTRRDLGRSVEELATFFASQLGVSAQGYEPHGDGGGAGSFDDAIVRELDLAAMHCRPTSLVTYEAVKTTLARTPQPARTVLAQVYTPYGTGFVPSRTQAEEIEKERVELWAKDRVAAKALAPDFLSDELRPASFGGTPRGSFVRMALTLSRTLKMFAKRYPDAEPHTDAVRRFLVHEAGDKIKSAKLFRELREDCNTQLTNALQVYDELRRQRVVVEIAAKKARAAEAERLSAEAYDKSRERKSRRTEMLAQKARALKALYDAAVRFSSEKARAALEDT